ncbi:hypothetical protein DL98DRAFT_395970, partial [Cadophora sp. DSE1049]
TMSFTLHILPGALYTRRVLIYLHEKNLFQSPFLTISPPLPTKPTATPSPSSNPNNTNLPPAPAPKIPKPKGPLPCLTTPDGTTIHDSLAIITYLEDLCDATQSLTHPPSSPTTEQNRNRETHLHLHPSSQKSNITITTKATPTMRGHTAEERARNGEIVNLVDEATTFFELAARNGSAMFALLRRQDLRVSKAALGDCRKVLMKVNVYYLDGGRFDDLKSKERAAESVIGTGNATVTIADIVLFALLEFAEKMYGVDLMEGLDGLRGLYERFKGRESAGVE